MFKSRDVYECQLYSVKKIWNSTNWNQNWRESNVNVFKDKTDKQIDAKQMYTFSETKKDKKRQTDKQTNIQTDKKTNRHETHVNVFTDKTDCRKLFHI